MLNKENSLNHCYLQAIYMEQIMSLWINNVAHTDICMRNFVTL